MFFDEKVDEKFEMNFCSLMVSFIMSGIITLILCVTKYDLDIFLIMHWFEAWLFSFVIAFPITRVILPFIKNRV